MSKGQLFFYKQKDGIYKLKGIYDLKPNDFGREVCKVLDAGKACGHTHYEWRHQGVIARIERIPEFESFN